MIACLVLLTQLAIAPETPAAHPWIVVQRDGARIALVARPDRKGNAFVGRLASNGQLVSLSAHDVDEPATESANHEKAPVPPPPSPPVWARGPRPTPPLGSVVTLKGSREEIERRLAAASGTAKAPADGPKGADEREADERRVNGGRKREGAIVVPDPTDDEGRGEAYWRRRGTRARDRIRRAEIVLAEAAREREAFDRAGPGASGYGAGTWAYALMQLRDAEERGRRDVAEAARAYEELRDEARRANAYPGWLRE